MEYVSPILSESAFTHAQAEPNPIMEARLQGAAAFRKGDGKEFNPYPYLSERFFAWLRGWHTENYQKLVFKDGYNVKPQSAV